MNVYTLTVAHCAMFCETEYFMFRSKQEINKAIINILRENYPVNCECCHFNIVNINLDTLCCNECCHSMIVKCVREKKEIELNNIMLNNSYEFTVGNNDGYMVITVDKK